MQMAAPQHDPEIAARQRWMRLLAAADAAELAALAKSVTDDLPQSVRLRGPEAGLVMLQGRAGGGGAAFNLGEMSVTRCTVRDAEGRIGHAYIAGRDTAKAELAARIDAAMQGPAALRIEAAVLTKLEAATTARHKQDAEQAAATRVSFFTLATMRTSS
jgi:alpha-D-ribose 1-methylphosphonate 5-triphosphate synthase subunit PhnG